ncbi:ABC transporter permease [Kineosporia babensis]|uniref:ABC transporter permease n=1 Tax=Kineosporia babensis TaxID=499548 RepID=A0A9X1SVV3_9ACTN|nr:ABC transporter permease [Kineosporia babensis]MCD5314096.1 ABC transporter permease [Kineosporia babensis]
MFVFLARRLMSGFVLVAVVGSLTFVTMSLSGTDPVRNLLGENATQEQVDARAAQLGLDRPLPERYLDWAVSAVQGDLGTSWVNNASVSQVIGQRLPVSLSLVIASTLVTALVSVALGIAAAVRKGFLDRLVQVLAVAGYALPNFWVALVLVSFFAISLRLLPATGYTPLTTDPGKWALGLVLPVAALAIGTIASTTQQVRAATVDVLEHDFVRTLRSRGLPSRSIVGVHVLRNAAGPALTVLSLQFVALLAGTVVIERVFALPGVGSMVVSSATAGDLPMVLGIVTVMVVVVVVVNLLVDVATGWLNPKVRAR